MAILTLCGGAGGPHRVEQPALRRHIQSVQLHLPVIGIEVTFVDPSDPEQLEKAIRPNDEDHLQRDAGQPDIKVFPLREVRRSLAYNISS